MENTLWKALKEEKRLYASCPTCHSRAFMTHEIPPIGLDPRLKQFLCQWGHRYWMLTRYHRSDP